MNKKEIKIQFENYTKLVNESRNDEIDFEIVRKYEEEFEKTEYSTILNDYMKEQFKISKQSLKKYSNYDEMNDLIDFAKFKAQKEHSEDYMYFVKYPKFFYDYLGNVEKILFEISEILFENVTYKKHKEILKEILNTFDEDYFNDEYFTKNCRIVEHIINDLGFYFEENKNKYFKGVEFIENDCENHFKIGKLILKNLSKDIIKILKENEIENLKFELKE